MQKKLLLDEKLLQITIYRLGQQLIENYPDFSDTILIGLQPRGVMLAESIADSLEETTGVRPPLGRLDTTFHRDDFRRRDKPVKANTTQIPFLLENKNVILIDDVLFTGRSVRAAMDALITFGRPKKVELLVLINRMYQRELPIEPNYVGRSVQTLESQRVLVELKAQGLKKDSIWLVT